MEIRWNRVGKKLTPNDITDAEGKLGVSFPVQYREFLLKTNGGEPKPSTVPYGDGTSLSVTNLFMLVELMQLIGSYRSDLGLPVDQIPIGLANDVSILVLDGEQVWLHSGCEGGIGQFGASYDQVSATFAEFLEKFQKPAPPGDSEKFIDACLFGDEKKMRKYLAKGVDWSVAAKRAIADAVSHCSTGESWSPLVLLLEAGVPRDVIVEFSLGVEATLEQYLKEHKLPGLRRVLVALPSEKTKKSLDQVQQIIEKYF